MSVTYRLCLVLLCFVALERIKPILAVEMTDEMKELMLTLHNTCKDDSGVEEDVITNARTGNFAEDPKLKCFMFCVLDQMGVVEDDGVIDEDGMLALMPEGEKDKAEKLIKGCGTKPGSDACDRVFQTNKCWYEASPKDYMLP